MKKAVFVIIENIKQELTSQTSSVTNILRKAKILAQLLKLNDFKIWIQNELSGYQDKNDLPNYRVFRATNLGTFSGPFQSGVKNMVIPTYNLPESVRDFAEFLKFFDGIGALEGMVDSNSNSLQRKWSQEAIILARDSIQISGGMVLVDAHSPIPKHAISGIIDNVKNKLLDFVIDLEDAMEAKDSSNSEDLSQTEKEQIFHVNIYGGENIVTTGNHNTTNISKVQNGNMDSLKEYLSKNGVPDNEIAELAKIIVKSPSMEKENLPKNFNNWFGRICSKAASGLLKVGVNTLPQLIMEGLSQYYGW